MSDVVPLDQLLGDDPEVLKALARINGGGAGPPSVGAESPRSSGCPSTASRSFESSTSKKFRSHLARMMLTQYYTPGEVINKGVSAEVFTVVEHGTFNTYAAKVYFKCDRDSIIEACTEQICMTRANSPHVLGCYGFYTHRGRPCLVLELARMSLRDFLQALHEKREAESMRQTSNASSQMRERAKSTPAVLPSTAARDSLTNSLSLTKTRSSLSSTHSLTNTVSLGLGVAAERDPSARDCLPDVREEEPMDSSDVLAALSPMLQSEIAGGAQEAEASLEDAGAPDGVPFVHQATMSTLTRKPTQVLDTRLRAFSSDPTQVKDRDAKPEMDASEHGSVATRSDSIAPTDEEMNILSMMGEQDGSLPQMQSLGTEVKQWVNAGLPLIELLYIIGSMLEAVMDVHAAGLAHCDLKPENIMMMEDGSVKLADFGAAVSITPETGKITATPLVKELDELISQRLQDNNLANNAVTAYSKRLVQQCTAAYAAPEMGNDADLRKVDVWALGCIAYELCSGGERIFSTDEMQKWIQLAQINDHWQCPRLPSHASSLQELIDAMLSVRVENRPLPSELMKFPMLRQIYQKGGSHNRARRGSVVTPTSTQAKTKTQLEAKMKKRATIQ